jgi:hypothetical protein
VRSSVKPPPIDHTRWIARMVEIITIAGAVVFAYLHSAR